MLYTVSDIESEHLEAIQDLEKELGKTLIAFTPLSVGADQLSPSALEKLESLEQALGLVLVAVKH